MKTVQQTRRQFFKTLATTAAGVVAVGVAPRVVGKGLGECTGWKNYTAEYKPENKEMLDTMRCKSRQQGMSGVTHDQLVDLIETTLKDIPQGMLEKAWNL